MPAAQATTHLPSGLPRKALHSGVMTFIALTHNCDAIALSTLCAPVKSPSRFVVFETEEVMASRHTVLALQKDASAREGRWKSQFIMLDQIRAPLAKILPGPMFTLYVNTWTYEYINTWISGYVG